METVKHWPKISYRVNEKITGFTLEVEDDRIKGMMQTIGTIVREQDTKAIVTACNSYGELVEIVKDYQRFMKNTDSMADSYKEPVLTRIATAIAKAEGK